MSISTRPGWLVYERRESVAEDLIARLHVRYPRERYALLEQVRDGPGYSASRTGDLVAVGLWPSRGCEVGGFEVKVSRADWLRELKAPQKAESLYAFCDRWWLVVPSARDTLRDGELPPTWGCIEAHGKERLHTVVAAPALAPQPMDRWLLAALLKRATAEPLCRARLSEAYAAGNRDGASQASRRGDDAEELSRQVARFERAATRLQREMEYTVQRAERAVKLVTARACPEPKGEEGHDG